MRRASLLVALLLAVTLSGCIADEDGEEGDDPLFGLCPSWEAGPTSVALSHHLNGSVPRTADLVGPLGNASLETHQGRALDVFRVRLGNVVVSGDDVLELRASSVENGTPRNIRDHQRETDKQLVPVLQVRAGENVTGSEYDVLLTAVAHGTPAAPGDVRLSWQLRPTDPAAPVTGVASVEATVFFLYRVCGAVLED